MMEFLKSCYMWIVENYKEIIMVLTSAQFASLVSGLFLLWKNVKSTRENVTSSGKLNETLGTTNKMRDDVAELKQTVDVLRNQNSDLKKETDRLNESVKEYQEVVLKKVNCMLEVQSIVYSTIKDETIRTTVNSILTNAKYTETATRAKLKEEVANLKDRLEKETERVKEITESATKNIAYIVEPDKTEYEEYVRY